MGQKANPTSLRLKATNKNFTSSWYSDIYYPDLVTQEFRIKEYLTKLFTQIRYPNPSLSTSFLPKKTRTIATYMNPLESRHRRCERFQLKLTQPVRRSIAPNGKAGIFQSTVSSTTISQGNGVEKAHNRNQSDKTIFSTSFIECNKRILVQRILLGIAVHKRVRKQLGWKKDFQFPQKLHNLTWFRGREETSLLLKHRESSISIPSIPRTATSSWYGTLRANSYRRGSLPFDAGESKCSIRKLSSREKKDPVLTIKRGAHFYTSCSRGDDTAPSLTEISIATICRKGTLQTPLLSDQLAKRKEKHVYVSRLESIISKGLTSPTTLYFYKSIHDTQAAHFLSDEIAYYLERRVPFRRIKQLLLREVRTCYIEGVRVICSGRMGGRSKKAQRARRERFQWGQTSSHLFSSKLSFASRSALTPLGKVGIKVWICYN